MEGGRRRKDVIDISAVHSAASLVRTAIFQKTEAAVILEGIRGILDAVQSHCRLEFENRGKRIRRYGSGPKRAVVNGRHGGRAFKTLA